MDFGSINYLAVAVASLVSFAVGAVWYGPLFSKPWMAMTGVTEEQAAEANMVKTFGLTFVMMVIMAVFLAAMIGGEGLVRGAITGLMLAVVFTGFSMAINDLFEMRPFKLTMINAGYNIVVYTLMGTIIGFW